MTGARILHLPPPALHVEAHGTDPAAPVICEELEWHNPSLPGQLCLWSLDCVRRAMAEQIVPPERRTA